MVIDESILHSSELGHGNLVDLDITLAFTINFSLLMVVYPVSSLNSFQNLCTH